MDFEMTAWKLPPDVMKMIESLDVYVAIIATGAPRPSIAATARTRKKR